MGIKDLNKFLRELCRDSFRSMPLSAFRGRRIAIDAANFMYIHLSTAHKEIVNKTDVTTYEPDKDRTVRVWINNAFRSLRRMMAAGITPVLVLDGKHPDEKGGTHTKRRSDKQKVRDRIAEKKADVESVDILMRTPDMVADLRKIMCQDVPMTGEDIAIFRVILEATGIPIIQATEEAEQLCSQLCREGLVSAVFSTDTDNYVYGCPLLITEFDRPGVNPQTGQQEDYVCTVNLQVILQSIGLTHQQFVDMCIMCGCDFNTNIPMVGVKKSYKAIQTYGSLDALPPTKFDVTCLNHRRCREIFSLKPSLEVCQTQPMRLDVNTTVLLEQARDVLSGYGAESWIPEFQRLFSGLITVAADVAAEASKSLMQRLASAPVLHAIPSASGRNEACEPSNSGRTRPESGVPAAINSLPSAVNTAVNTAINTAVNTASTTINTQPVQVFSPPPMSQSSSNSNTYASMTPALGSSIRLVIRTDPSSGGQVSQMTTTISSNSSTTTSMTTPLNTPITIVFNSGQPGQSIQPPVSTATIFNQAMNSLTTPSFPPPIFGSQAPPSYSSPPIFGSQTPPSYSSPQASTSYSLPLAQPALTPSVAQFFAAPQPSSQPPSQPSSQPSSQPPSQPSSQPSSQPQFFLPSLASPANFLGSGRSIDSAAVSLPQQFQGWAAQVAQRVREESFGISS